MLTQTYLVVIIISVLPAIVSVLTAIISVLTAMNVSPDVQNVTSERPTAVTLINVYMVRSQGLQNGLPV